MWRYIIRRQRQKDHESEASLTYVTDSVSKATAPPPAKINKIKMTQGLCVKYAIPVYIILIFLSVNSVANYLFSPQNQNHFFRRMATNTPNGKEVKHVITIWKETFQAGMYRKVGLPRLLKLQGEL